MMSKEEIPLSRFLNICEWLEINLTEIEKIASYQNINQDIEKTVENPGVSSRKCWAENPIVIFEFQN